MTGSLEDLPANMRARLRVEDGHWLWTGATYWNGYGQITGKVDGRRVLRRVHRVVWELLAGALGELTLHHREDVCGVKLCANPAHLEPLTRAEHQRRHNPEQATCGKGHDPAEMTRRRNGRQQCRACVRERQGTYRERKRAAAT